MLDGDKENGAFMAGQISGMITEIKPVAQILEDVWSQAEDLLN